jgi:hypothetical protein
MTTDLSHLDSTPEELALFAIPVKRPQSRLAADALDADMQRAEEEEQEPDHD